MTPEPPWKPSRREQHLLWWLQLLMRYVVGGGGLIWELTVDRLSDPVALLVFGALATSTDVFRFAKGLIAQAKADTLAMERSLDSADTRASDSEIGS